MRYSARKLYKYTYLALGMPVPIFLCRSYCIGLAKELEESAIIDGCSRTKMLYKIVLPLIRPILVTVAVLNALWVWGENFWWHFWYMEMESL